MKKISIKASTFSLGRKYVIALKATDDGQNQSPHSNLAQIYRPSSDDSSTSATASTDSTSSTVPASSPSNLTSSTESSTTKDPFPISTELTNGLSVGVFLGSFCATLLGLSSLEDSKLNYILSVIGAIYWHKMRHR